MVEVKVIKDEDDEAGWRRRDSCWLPEGWRRGLTGDLRGGGFRLRGFCGVDLGAFFDGEAEIRDCFAIVEDLEIVLGEVLCGLAFGIADYDGDEDGVDLYADSGGLLRGLRREWRGGGQQEADDYGCDEAA